MAQRESFIRKFKDLEKRIGKLELVKQDIGADIVQIVNTTLASASSGTIASGGRVVFTTTVAPSSEILTLWDLLHSFYIDTDADADFIYPTGSSLTSGQKDLDFQWSYDFEASDEDTGQRTAKLVIINNDSSSHEYFLYVKWYGIKQTL